ncbi:type I-E CRISPR-associated protein Cse2/CasB [Desulfurivibrio dismutans]|uniref:type I-E CRISPR-associated protein Cse2/CasB n=1 Tax=Desulfurivibrio dismutans TaxID=1398908 RepID=UPI0023DA956F|nr:type I-E CRISPR-associated protein Cse2/CasB [Desulfurivibrio alkaliphilus]MDF1614962.1 type I-E CRISPR-associated protein Cse2/CasB [Desulfurivibrio alkaliphilus]
MTGFIEWLENLSKKDTKVRAVLRRSLSFYPGTHVPAFPYVEPFIKDEGNSWRREMFYLVAGVWAAHWREGRAGAPMTLPRACATYQTKSDSASIERRFISLLDADRDQLPHRLRQMVALLKDYSLDFASLLRNEKTKNGLLNWLDPQKRTQNAWAREYYKTMGQETTTEPITEEESK